MRLTVEQVLDAATITTLYRQYVEAFGPVRTLAAARHVLTAEEFAAEMTDRRINKYVAWADDGPVGVTTLATDLAAVPWISQEYYAARFPDHYARGAIFYLGISFVDPARRRQFPGAYVRMMRAALSGMDELRAVVAYDVCAYNEIHGSGRNVAAVSRLDESSIVRLDTQVYSAAVFGGAAGDGAPALDGGAPAPDAGVPR